MTTYRRPRDRKPTTTTLVLSWLSEHGDFATARQLAEAVRRSPDQTSSALRWLRKRKAVDCLEEDGRLWWFSTIEYDDRTRIIAEITADPIVRTRRVRKAMAP